MKTFKFYYLLALSALVATLVGCGGGSDSASSPGNRTVGAVKSVSGTQVTVSSTTFDTSSSTMSGDEIAGVEEIQVGMVVEVKSDDDGHAEEIEYDAEIEGIVDSVSTDSMLVMGQTVDISQNPTFVDEMGVGDIGNIPPGAMIEVSGYSDGLGNIVATYVKLEDHMANSSDDMELEGIITDVNSVDGTFVIGAQTIYFDQNDFELIIEVGLNVEVDIMMDDITQNLHAVEIEIEDEHEDEHGSNGSVEIEGMVSGDLGLDLTFTINGAAAVLTDNVRYEDGMTQGDIIDGAIIEVEGHVDENGTLVVDEVGAVS